MQNQNSAAGLTSSVLICCDCFSIQPNGLIIHALHCMAATLETVAEGAASEGVRVSWLRSKVVLACWVAAGAAVVHGAWWAAAFLHSVSQSSFAI